MNLGNNATNDQRGSINAIMQKQTPSMDAITWKHGYNTNLGISNKNIYI